MKKNKIEPLNVNKFNLNDDSIKFANYFNCILIFYSKVNNQEINCIKKIFDSCKVYNLLLFLVI